MYEFLYDISAWVLPLVLAITLHEAAHGFVAHRLGDPTAYLRGRVTFNPFKHIDRFGTIILPGLLMLMKSPFMFGYAKPVPVDFSRLRRPRRDMVLVAAAGPGINLLLAFISALLLYIEQWVTPEQAPWLFMNIYRMLMINVVLAVFNMIPMLPLDGGRVLVGLLPPSWAVQFSKTERFGFGLVLIVFMLPAVLELPFSPSEYLIGIPAEFVIRQLMYITGHSG